MADKLDSSEVFKRFFNLKAGDYPLSPKPNTDPGVNKEWKWDTQNNKWVTVSVKTEPLSNGQQNIQQTNGGMMMNNGVSTYDTGMYTQAGIESLTDYNNYTTEKGFDYPVAKQATHLDTSKYRTVKDYVCSEDFMQDIIANTKEEYDAQCSRPIEGIDEFMYETMTLDEILDEGWKCFKQYKIQSGMGILMQSGLYNFDDGSCIESSKEYEDIDSSKYPWVITDTKTDAVTPLVNDELASIFEEKLFSENVYHLPPDRDYRETERRNLKKQKERYERDHVKSDSYDDFSTYDDFVDDDVSYEDYPDDDGYLSEDDAWALVKGSRRRHSVRRAGMRPARATRRAGRHYIGRIVRRSSAQRRRAYAEGTVGSLSLRDVIGRIYDAVDEFVREQRIDEDPMTVVTTYDGPDGLVLRVYVNMSRDDMERLGLELDDIVSEINDAGFFETSLQGNYLSVVLENVGAEYCDDDDGYETCMASRRMARHMPRRMAHSRMPRRRMAAGRTAGRISRIPMGRMARKSRLVRSRRQNRYI